MNRVSTFNLTPITYHLSWGPEINSGHGEVEDDTLRPNYLLLITNYPSTFGLPLITLNFIVGVCN